MEVAVDSSDAGTPEGWLDCQTRTPFQPFKNLPSVLWTQEEVDLFDLRVNKALRECLYTVNPQNLSLKLAQAKKVFLEHSEIVPNSFYVLGKQNLVRTQLFKMYVKAESTEE